MLRIKIKTRIKYFRNKKKCKSFGNEYLFESKRRYSKRL